MEKEWKNQAKIRVVLKQELVTIDLSLQKSLSEKESHSIVMFKVALLFLFWMKH